jgi:hypothetical protein
MPVNVSSMNRGTIFINYKSYGWSETFDMPPAPIADNLTKLKQLAKYRARTLPPAASVVYVRLSDRVDVRKSLGVIDAPYAGYFNIATAPAVTQINDPCTALCFRVQAEDFAASTRFIRGVPDDSVKDTVFQEGPPVGGWMWPLTSTFAVEDNPAAAASYLDAVKDYLSVVARHTVVAKKIPAGPGHPILEFEANTILGYIFRGVRRHDTGRPFGQSRGRQTAR